MGEVPPFLRRVASFLQRYLKPGEPLLVAFSGGPDSVGLVACLQELGYPFALAYVNYHLRGAESLEEEAWVRAFAEKHALPLYVRSLAPEDLQGPGGRQAQARRLRYAWMERLLQDQGLAWGATAHTWDDQVETLLYRLVRGAGPGIWEGIPARRGPWLRPLLQVRRAELLAFLREKGLSYRLDSSNYTPLYLRNQVRWWVLPALYRLNPSLSALLQEKWRLYQKQRRRLEALYDRWAARTFQPQPYGVLLGRKLPWDAFWVLAKKRWRLSRAEIQAVWRLWHQGTVGAARAAQEYQFVRVPHGLQVGRAEFWEPAWEPLRLLPEPLRCEWGLWRIEVGVSSALPEEALVWDRERLAFPLSLRLWKQGDKIAPAGLGGHHKRLSDVWPEVGLYGFARRHAFVVEDATGRIVGAAGYRVAEGAAPGPHTQTFFYLRAQYGQSPPP
ncbi:MAG: hypothetical protein KatS3mg026_1151 [Bacteroidia bacterium]|nr:MAG: hypothetical protein KatS3mg026_1151 [Bacteroidia bacterium]